MKPNLSGSTGQPDSTWPELLSQMTVQVRARIGPKGWASTLVDWGDDSARSFRIYTRRAGENPEDAAWDGIHQNYLSFPDSSGVCDVLEAEVAFRNHNPKWTSMRVGVPAARIGKGRVHDIVLRFSTARLSLFVDGVLVDEDWPVGCMPSNPASPRIGGAGFDGAIEQATMWPRAWSDAEIIEQAGGRERVSQRQTDILGPDRDRAQYWTPRGHNQWVGDIMLGDTLHFDEKRLHLFYLIDRRHHTSKFGCGGHFVAHMSSTDLTHWEHHPVALDIDEQWETVGTGRPFVHKGKLLLFYGMHTSRIMPQNLMVTPGTDADGLTIPQPFPDKAGYPLGTSFAESDDGLIFRKSRLLVHSAQNPNVSPDDTGDGFLMLAGYGATGLWHSSDLLRWKIVDEAIVPLDRDSPARNSSECQCLFEWNGWHYIIGGRTGFWMSRSQRGPYWAGKFRKNVEVATPRWDIYDGLWVPMVAPFKNNRRILAGFLQGPDFGWAGHLVFRELIQFEDGTLGTKWPAEMVPPVSSRIEPVIHVNARKLAGNSLSVAAADSSWALIDGLPPSLRLSAQVAPGPETTHAGIAAFAEDGDGCALSFLTHKGRAQWNTMKDDHIPSAVPSLDEILSQDRSPISQTKNPHIPFKGGDFAITGVEGLHQPFTVEMVFVYDPKSRSTIIDACINGCRTMITRRKGLTVKRLRLLADGEAGFRNITLGALGDN